MKITTEEKSAEKLSKKIVRISLTEGNQTRFIKDSNNSTRIEIKINRGDKNSLRKFIKTVRRIIRITKQYRVEKIAIDIDEFKKISNLPLDELGSIIAQNIKMAGYEFLNFKTKPKTGWGEIKEIFITNISQKSIVSGILKGNKIGELVNECRLISNTPGGDMTPKILANHAKRLSKDIPVKVSILGKKEITRLKMGAILGVSKGSTEEPKFIIMEYKGGKKDERPIVFVGKGVTFDSGGINLKPSEMILGMHMDMSGGAAVIASVALIAKLKIRKNVIGLVPSVENMTSGNAFRPGDVLKSMSGKTIEIINTDAEGRLVIADALTYAKKFNPRVVIDIATLTGASIVALGQHASALMTRDKKLQEILMEIGEKTGDYVWPLPLWEEYEVYIKGQIADVANLSTRNPQYGGSINGGIFLEHFTRDYKKDCKWAHLDTSPRMTTIPSDNLSVGAAGEPVRLLTKFAEEY